MTSSRKSTQTRKSKGSNFLPHEMCEQCTGVLFADYDKSIRQARLQFFETCRALFSQAHPGRLVHHQVRLPFFALFDAFVRGRATIGSGIETCKSKRFLLAEQEFHLGCNAKISWPCSRLRRCAMFTARRFPKISGGKSIAVRQLVCGCPV